MIGPPESIDCVECGGVAHLISYLPDDEDLEEGYPVAYVCTDCNHRHDLVWEADNGD